MISNIDKKALSVFQLLSLECLNIPAYQRPYKWTLKNINDLLLDISSYIGKSAYRLGSVVFHHRQEKNGTLWLDIVDGQQRTLTLLLMIKAIMDACRPVKLERQDLNEALATLRPTVKKFMERQRFASQISESNLQQNYHALTRLVSRPEFSEAHIDFLLNRCQVVVFVLADVSEAFQFFDSQNARGRDLEPHDLLKAFHLREFSEHEVELKADSVAHWEKLPSDVLADLFAIYLYRIRQWAEGKSARHFGKEQVGLFKGVNLDQIGNFPYVESLRITHHFVDDYNRQYQRKIDRRRMAFPFHLDQTIINGRRFFEMAEHYQQQVSNIINIGRHARNNASSPAMMGEALDELAMQILNTLNSYRNRVRVGDQYVRSMFDCALIFYIDKFGSLLLSAAIKTCFIWAYQCRIRQQVVQLATMDNYVLQRNLFRVIRDARLPSDVFSWPQPTLKTEDNGNNHRDQNSADKDELVALFREMKYYE